MRPAPLAITLAATLVALPASAQEPTNGRGISQTFSQRGISLPTFRAPSNALRVPTGSRVRFPSRSATPNVIRFDGPVSPAPIYTGSSRIFIGTGHGGGYGPRIVQHYAGPGHIPFSRCYTYTSRGGCYYRCAPAYAVPTAGTGSAYDASRGWEDLSRGDGYLAMRMFATVCERNEIDALCRAGFALGASMAGRDRQAIFGMRQAATTNVDALRYAPLDDRLEPRLQQLIARYERQSTDRRDDSADLFMIASIKFMLHDNEGAYEALLRADAVGERTDSVIALGSAIEAIFDAEAQAVIEEAPAETPEAETPEVANEAPDVIETPPAIRSLPID